MACLISVGKKKSDKVVRIREVIPGVPPCLNGGVIDYLLRLDLDLSSSETRIQGCTGKENTLP
jgi:hypothetical protein